MMDKTKPEHQAPLHPSVAPPADEQSHREPTHQRTILICEDDEGIRELLVEAVQGEGFAVEAVSNGRDALEYLRSGKDRYLVLLDLMMPAMSGYEMLDHMAADPQLPGDNVVVVISATGFVRPVSPGVVQKRLVRGFLKKPFDLDELFALLHQFA